MLLITRMSVQRNIALFFAVLGILVGGTWMTVKITTEHLLYQDATSTAQSWARFLAVSVADLEQIASGEQPSSASMTFLQSARKSGEVFRYEIFNRDGYSQLVSERDKIALVDLSEHSDDAVRSVTTGRPIVDVNEGNSVEQPAFIARAYVPVLVDGRAIAVVAAYLDETAQRRDFYDAFMTARLPPVSLQVFRGRCRRRLTVRAKRSGGAPTRLRSRPRDQYVAQRNTLHRRVS